jgi:NADPH:quinone reductase-like Zn-dependent oxidoreductase
MCAGSAQTTWVVPPLAPDTQCWHPAAQFVDYTKQPLQTALAADASAPRFHAILDAVGLVDPALYVACPAFTTPDAVYAHVGPTPTVSLGGALEAARFVWHALLRPRALGGTRRAMKIIGMQHSRERLQDIARLVEEAAISLSSHHAADKPPAPGKVRPVVDSVFAFEDALKAYERIMTGRAKGKVVVRVDPDAEWGLDA